MSSSHARKRIAAIAAAVPVLVAGGPLVLPATAAETGSVRTAQLVETLGDLRIGPRAGFRGDVARGVNGHTAIVAFDASPSATLGRVSVSVVEDRPFALYDEFDPTDGFALYKDLNDNDRLDPADFAAGPVSLPRYDIGFNSGAVVVTVNADPAKATGADSYLLTVHPSANLQAERVVNFAIPAGGITTSAGSLPASALALRDIVLDSLPPAAIPLSNFTPVSRAPQGNCPTPKPAEGCGDDFYKVVLPAPGESLEKLAFFNAAGDLSDAALLTKTVGDQTVHAIYDVSGINVAPAAPSDLSIGNGTGRQAGVPGSRALNNQISDDLVAVQWDQMGNTVATPLNNTPTCNQNPPLAVGCTSQPPKGNDVTGVSMTYTPSMGATNAAANTSAVLARAALPANNDAGVDGNVLKTAIRSFVRPQRLAPVAGSNPAAYTVVAEGTEVNSSPVTPGTAQNVDVSVNVSSVSLFPENERLWSAIRLVDAYGNDGSPRNTTAQLKDTIRPTFSRISLVDSNGNGNADQGEVYRIAFDDNMDATDIDTAAELQTRLTIGEQPPNCSASAAGCVNWGANPTLSWSTPARVLSVTLGAPCTAPSAECSAIARLPKTGDVVVASTSSSPGIVSDWNENAMVAGANSIAIAPPAILPVQARTVDTAGLGTSLYGTSRDGVIDRVELEFSKPVSAASVTAASDAGHFRLTWGGTTVTATGTRSTVADDTVILTFTLPDAVRSAWNTGATPLVELKANADGSTLLEAAVANEPVPAFTQASLDRAAPVPVSVKTQDVNSNGKLDRVLVEFTEAIKHRSENACGWTVSGYGDANYKPVGFPTATACTPARNEPSAVPAGAAASNTVALKLPEGSAFDTGVTPFVEFRSTNAIPTYTPGSAPSCVTGTTTQSADCPILDGSGNTLSFLAGTATDAAGPAIVERTTADTNGDGRLDEVRVKFSEKLSTPSIQHAQFTLSDPAFTIMSGFGVPSDTEIYLRLENGAQRDGNTGVTPKLLFQGGTTDVAGAASPADAAPVTVTDKAAPAIMGACAGGPAATRGSCPLDDATSDKVAIFLSEPLASASVALTDFVVEQPAGTAKTPTAFVLEDGDKRVVLTFAEGAVKSNLDGQVKFAAAGSVQDKAPAPNASTQVGYVPMFKAPEVTIDLTCPIAAKPGFCSANTINTGVTGSSGVTRWRLETSPRGATPDDAQFKSGIPATYPPAGILPEGKLELFLSAKDDFGRITAELSDTITILKAPQISGLQFATTTSVARTSTKWPSTTLLDGDTVKMGANASGTDAAEWAAKSAGTTTGDCFSRYMSVDVRSILGKSTAGAVAPATCNMLTGTEKPTRQMLFPSFGVAGTTKYPVGTALKISDSDPGFLVVDGPNGTLARRNFISVNARRSWMISDASVIKVSTGMRNALPRLTKNIGYRDGAVVKGSTTGYYYVENGVKRPVSTYRLRAWRISTARAYTLTTTELRAMPTGTTIGGTAHAPGTWIKYSDGRIYQIVKNGQGTVVRRKVASLAALRTLVPTGTRSQVYPANSSDSRLPIDSWLRGYRDGTLLKFSDGSFGVIARGSLRKFAEARTFNTLGYNAANSLSASTTAMPRENGQTYRTGVVIDRYELGEVVIKVTNTADMSATVEVPNSAGLFGLGRLDPAPAGWDPTR